MKKYFIDTNIFLRFILQDVPPQSEAARRYFNDAKDSKIEILLCSPVIFELDFVLSKFYKFDKKEVVKSIGVLLTLPYLEVDEREIFQQALIEYSQGNYDLVDCYLYVKALHQDAEVLTFDQKLSGKTKKARG